MPRPQYLDQVTTWNGQVQVCIDHEEIDLVLDVYRLRVEEASRVGADVTKWGDLKAADLAKEQGERTISALGD